MHRRFAWDSFQSTMEQFKACQMNDNNKNNKNKNNDNNINNNINNNS